MCRRPSSRHDTFHRVPLTHFSPSHSCRHSDIETDRQTGGQTDRQEHTHTHTYSPSLTLTPCLFLEFLAVRLDLSGGDLRHPAPGSRVMTAGLLISKCVSVCVCVCVRASSHWMKEQRIFVIALSGLQWQTVELWWTESKHNQCSTHSADAHQPNTSGAFVTNSCPER